MDAGEIISFYRRKTEEKIMVSKYKEFIAIVNSLPSAKYEGFISIEPQKLTSAEFSMLSKSNIDFLYGKRINSSGYEPSLYEDFYRIQNKLSENKNTDYRSSNRFMNDIERCILHLQDKIKQFRQHLEKQGIVIID